MADDSHYGNGGTDEARFQRLETEQIHLRRDLTAAVASDRQILERIAEMHESTAKASGELLLLVNRVVTRLGIVEALVSDTAKSLELLVMVPKRKARR